MKRKKVLASRWGGGDIRLVQLGAIFDFDGVVIDSSRQHEESWEILAREEGKPLFEGYFKQVFGRRNVYIIPEMLRWTNDPIEVERISERKEELYRQLLAEQGLDTVPGIGEFLEELAEAGVPRVIGSSTSRENLDTALAQVGLAGWFDAIVSAEDVAEGKPHPEVFLTAASRIGVPPEHCVVFEDALMGIEAAQAGGIKVIAVATTNSPDKLNHADRVIMDMTGVNLPMLKDLFHPVTRVS